MSTKQELNGRIGQLEQLLVAAGQKLLASRAATNVLLREKVELSREVRRLEREVRRLERALRRWRRLSWPVRAIVRAIRRAARAVDSVFRLQFRETGPR